MTTRRSNLLGRLVHRFFKAFRGRRRTLSRRQKPRAAFTPSLEPLEVRKLLAGMPLLIDVVAGAGGSSPEDFTNVGGTLFFTADDGTGDRELWTSDGTPGGTVRVEDINPAASSSPSDLTNVNGTLFFSADDGTYGRELWTSDGTAAGTAMVEDINPGGDGMQASYGVENVRNVNGILLFSANDGTSGRELWKSDGTPGGTELVKDINTGGDSVPRYFENVNGMLFFSANDGSTGAELWKSDGSAGGTAQVADIEPGPFGSEPRFGENVNGTFFFEARDSAYGVQLWKSNGTAGGTLRLTNLAQGAYDTSVNNLTNVSGTLFFQSNEVNGFFPYPMVSNNLWATDGSVGGETQLSNYAAVDPVNFNGLLLFGGYDPTDGLELMKSDGTVAGTVVVKGIRPGTVMYGPNTVPASSQPRNLAVVDGTLFFSANDGTTGTELWKSDGTEAGTQRVDDINSGPGGSNPEDLTSVGTLLFFQANDGTNGDEPWVLDTATPPDSFVVTTEIDENDGTADPGAGAGTSLREAIIAANADPNQTTITFDPALDGTPILLAITGTDEDAAADGDLDITSEVTINGNGPANTIIDAGADVDDLVGTPGLMERVLHVLGSGNLTLDGVTLTGGNAAGAGGGTCIAPGGTATVTNSTISGNFASGGGGIFNSHTGTATVTNSTVSGNSASDSGGGIVNFDSGTVRFTNSTIFGNSASIDGGGLFNVGNATIINSTVSGNSASSRGGGVFNDRTATVTNSTIAGNSASLDGGGIFNSAYGTATLANTVVAGNTIAGPAPNDIAGLPVEPSSVNNLIGDAATSGGLTHDNDGDPGSGTNNIVGVDWTIVLENDGTTPTLADNGGPTQTIALLAGSPAIDAGSNDHATEDGTPVSSGGTQLTTDQRGPGFDRIVDGGRGAVVDIGAFELMVTTKDFGDAPDALQSGFANDYPVTEAEDGARHVPGGPTLGPARDAEVDGVHSTGAGADDTTGDTPDDEDGVTFGTVTAGVAGEVTVDVQGGTGRVVIWVDFNQDGIWDNATEKVHDADLAATVHNLSFPVPLAAQLGTTYARVRIASDRA